VNKSSPSSSTCVLTLLYESSGLGEYGLGDSGVTSESWVWRESIEDDGSRSGQLGMTSSIMLWFESVPSYGPSCDAVLLIAKLCKGQFIVM